MKQQGAHPEDTEGTSDASSRPGTPDDGPEAAGEKAQAVAEGSGSRPGRPARSPTTAHVDEVEGDEPLLPARVHRPSDLMRLLVGVLAVAVLLAIAAFAHGTTSGLEQDINKGTGQAPDLLIKIAGLASSIAILLVPVAFAIERLIKRDGLRIADGVLAAVLAHGVTLATDLWVARAAPDSIQEALTQPSPGDIHALTDPVHGYLAPVIAYMTAVGMSRRPRWRAVLWVVLLLDAFSMLVTGYTTPFSIILTVLIGWTVAYGTLYAVGSPNVRPTGQTLMAGLRTVGFRPVSASREDTSDNPDTGDRGRRYFVTLEDGPPLDVTVVDREQQAQGFFYRAWRNLTLRGFATRSSLQSLRQALEQEALLAYAAIAAGANAPKLIATSELGPDAVMLVYEHSGGRTLDSLSDEEITDDLLRDTWHQVKALQSRRIAHRRLVGDAILVDRSGKVILTDLRVGEIAAGDLLLRMDISQLLVTARPAGGRRARGGLGGGRARPGRGGRLPADAPAHRAEPLHARDAAQTGPGAGTARARGGAGGVPAGQAGPPGGGRVGRGRAGPGKARQEGRTGRAAGREAGHRRGSGGGARGGPAHADPAPGAADQAAGAGRAGPAGASPAAHAAQFHRRCDRRVLPADAAHPHRVRAAHRERPVGLGRRGGAVLGVQLPRGGDGAAGVRARAGAVPADRGGAGRRARS